jgi:hypothetical protein
MSKRLIRMKNPDAYLKLEQGTEINAVLQNGQTYFGKLNAVSTAILTLTDPLGYTHQIALQDIYEIIYDR